MIPLPSSPRSALRLAALCLLPLGCVCTAGAQEVKPDWLTGQGVSLGGIFYPHFHFNAVYGGTSAQDPEALAAGHHDPADDGWTWQGFEPGLSIRLNERFQGFVNAHIFYDEDQGEWDGQMEEWFGKIAELPFGFELRGGTYLNRFGMHNATHLHGWDFADNNLVNGRFLGDDGLYTLGGELTWTLPLDSTSWTSLLTASVGEAQREEHHHHHEDGGEEEEPEFEAEGALFDSVLTTVNWTNIYRFSDFHQIRGGLSGAWGDNVWGRSTQVYGMHVEYQWRQNGMEPGGRYFRWRTEAMLRHFSGVSGHLPGEEEEHGEEAHHESHEEEHEESHHESPPQTRSFTDAGFATSAVYGIPSGFAGPWEFALRAEYVSGESAAGLDERWRLTPGLRLFFNPERTAYLGVQYNFDHSSESGTDHSIWLQAGINWGGAEVR